MAVRVGARRILALRKKTDRQPRTLYARRLVRSMVTVLLHTLQRAKKGTPIPTNVPTKSIHSHKPTNGRHITARGKTTTSSIIQPTTRTKNLSAKLSKPQLHRNHSNNP